MKQVAVSFPLDVNITRSQITELVNCCLDSVKAEVLSWNGFVDLRETEDGNYVLIAKCDNEAIRSKMQDLLNMEVSRLNAA
ncbi:MAG: hypothetical protein ABIN36_09915 [Ferruginibacter sp.]